MASSGRWFGRIWLVPIFAVAGLAACGSANDDSLLDPTAGGTSSGAPGEDGGTSGADGGASSGDAGTTTQDGGVSSADAGGDAAAGTNAFTGAGAYQNTSGPSSRKGAHNFAGNTPSTNPAKQACLSCHVGGDAPKFLFAGTVFADANGQTPAASVEVAVRDGAGNRVIVRTDQDGNFYRKPGAGDPTFPAQTAARDGANVRLMTAAIVANGGGDRNACHKTGAAGVIHVP